MRNSLFALAVCCGLAAPAAAQEVGARPFDKGTHVTIVGQISSQPRKLGFATEEKMQIAVGPEKVDHTLHLNDAKMFDRYGREIFATDLRDKWWVLAEGTIMDDPRRISVSRLEILGKDRSTYRKSAQFRPRYELGYVLAQNVAGERQVFPTTRVFKRGQRVVIVAPISSQPRDAGVAVEEKMQVAIGPDKTDYTLHFDDVKIMGPQGGEMAASGLRDRMWVRAEGKVMKDSRRIDVESLRVIAMDDETYRGGPFFQPGGEYGYIAAR